MKKDMKRFKDAYLEELNFGDDVSNTIKSKIGVKPNDDKSKTKSSLFTNRRKPLILGGSFVLVLLIAVVSIVSIINYRNTPVYQGMDADNMPAVRSSNRELYSDMDIYRKNIRGLNRNVRYKEHEDHTNNKYGDKFDEQIEDLEQQIGVIVDDRIVCYAQPGEVVIITVKIDNPKFFEILSFTLNGKLYQTFEFVDGSDSSQIKVKFTVQETSGLQEITIDAIKYVDDTTIKNVRFEGDKTIKLGVTYQNPPQVTQVNEINNGSNFALSFNVSDVDNLINLTNGLNIYLFDAEKLVYTNKLSLGNNLIPYSNLKLGNPYTYVIMGVYDLYDGLGKKAYVLHQNTFETQNGYTYNLITPTYDSILLSYNKLEGFDGTLKEINVYKGEELVQTVTENLENAEVFGLLSNTEYKVVTTYKYSILENNVSVEQEQSIETTVKTLERPIPTLAFKDEVLTQDSISFDYEIVDTTNVGKVVKVEVYNKDQLVNTYEEDIRTFDSLLSDNDYKFVITYEYDLFDGNGINTITFENVFHTVKKTVPTAVFTNSVPFMNNLYIWFEVDDVDGIIEIISIDIMKDGIALKSITKEEFANYNESVDRPGFFTGDTLVSGLEAGDYTLVFKYQYDMHDGNEKIMVDENHPTADNKLGVTVN